jgi:hypothetical protein
VSHDTPRPWNILEDERGCILRVWDAGPDSKREGELDLTGSVTRTPYVT